MQLIIIIKYLCKVIKVVIIIKIVIIIPPTLKTSCLVYNLECGNTPRRPGWLWVLK